MKEVYIVITKLGIQTFMAGNLVRLRAEFYKDHVLEDADALPNIKLKIGSAEWSSDVPMTKVADTTGIYEYEYQVIAGQAAATIRYRIEGLIDTKIVSAEEVFNVTARTS